MCILKNKIENKFNYAIYSENRYFMWWKEEYDTLSYIIRYNKLDNTYNYDNNELHAYSEKEFSKILDLLIFT